MYQAIENMGFQTGNILEPSMGVGNFFGMLPEGMKHSRLYGVELDSLSGRIAKQLYPHAHITISGFEQTSEKDFYDLAIGNVPFGQYRVNDPAFNKYASVKGKDQQRFVRFHSLGEGYSEEDIQAVIAGEKKHRARIKSPLAKEERAFNLLLVIDDKIRAKGPGYQQWATNYNLKQMAKTRIFLKEHNINSMDELREKANSTSADFDRIDKELKSAEQRLVEIAALKKNIINYAKTREVYVQYRKAGYSKAFFEAHREEITLHKAAKDAFQKMGVSKLPKVKELSEEYATVLEQKKSLYAQYRLSREEMREYQKALHNTEVFFDMDRIGERDNRTQSEVEQKNQPAK